MYTLDYSFVFWELQVYLDFLFFSPPHLTVLVEVPSVIFYEWLLWVAYKPDDHGVSHTLV